MDAVNFSIKTTKTRNAKENICTRCNKKGHWDKFCWTKQKAGNKPDENPDKLLEEKNKEINRILNDSNFKLK